jgi:hypothetical protein
MKVLQAQDPPSMLGGGGARVKPECTSSDREPIVQVFLKVSARIPLRVQVFKLTCKTQTPLFFLVTHPFFDISNFP